MSYSYVLPAEQSSSGAAKRWLLAYAAAQLMCFALATAAAAIARAMAWPADSHEQMGLTAAVAAAYGLTFGLLRANILRHRLAAFRPLQFCAALTIVSFFFAMPLPAAMSGLVETGGHPQAVLRLLLPVVLSGLGYGLVIGAAEAFAMRRAAYGLTVWIAMSAIAWAGGLVAATMAASHAATLSLTLLETVLIAVAVALLQALTTALLMLPALRSLTPRLSYYGPRAFRPLLRRMTGRGDAA